MHYSIIETLTDWLETTQLAFDSTSRTHPMRITPDMRSELNRLLCKAIAHGNSDHSPARAQDYANELKAKLHNLLRN
jgi:hypothetical protein